MRDHYKPAYAPRLPLPAWACWRRVEEAAAAQAFTALEQVIVRLPFSYQSSHEQWSQQLTMPHSRHTFPA